jgi:hypothetical protein
MGVHFESKESGIHCSKVSNIELMNHVAWYLTIVDTQSLKQWYYHAVVYYNIIDFFLSFYSEL